MLTPTVAYRYRWLYAIGNTAATDLARNIPHGQDASLLLLGCGDLRNILYTSYVEKGLAARKLDFTCCDINENIIARNLVLLTMILAEEQEVSAEALWDIYYHMYLDEQTTELVGRHVQAVIQTLDSLESFMRSPYGSSLKICDDDTLNDVRKALQRISSAAENGNREEQVAKLSSSLQSSRGGMEEGRLVLTALRSAAPRIMDSKLTLPHNYEHYWKEGVAMIQGKTAETPNPMLAGLVSEWELLHYGSDPLLSFHLATAFTDLPDHSPLKPDVVEGEEYRVVAAARTQFFAWVHAFRSLKDRFRVRFVVSDAFAFSHTLQYAGATGKVSANWYRRLWDSRVLCLDRASYGHNGTAPTKFDAIETSNLSDQFDTLNILVSASPLLKPKPWATLHTEKLFGNCKSGQQSLDKLLHGPSTTVSLLLGLIPLQYWTNAKVESHVDEVFMLMLSQSGDIPSPSQFRTRLAWRRDDQFGGYDVERPKIHMEAKDVAETLFQMYLEMFENEREEVPSSPSDAKNSDIYPRFHRGSFTALLGLVKGRVKTDWEAMLEHLLGSIEGDPSLTLAGNQVQDFHVQLFLSKLHTGKRMYFRDDDSEVDSDGDDDGYVDYDDDDDDDDDGDEDDDDGDVPTMPIAGPLSGWRRISCVVAVTLVVSRDTFDGLFPQPDPSSPIPTLVGTLSAGANAPKQWLSVFDDVHIVFGRVTASGDMASGDAVVSIQEDELGWSGTSPLIATFLVPTTALLEEPVTGLVGLRVAATSAGSITFAPSMGLPYTIYETTLSNTARVFISKLMPGTSAHKVMSGGVRPFKDAIAHAYSEGAVTLTASMSPEKHAVASLTARMHISSRRGKTLLRDKAPIRLQQSDPFTIKVVFDNKKLTCPLKYPVPVTRVGSKTRIARTSGYIEVMAPLASPNQSKILRDFISPTMMTWQGLPVAVNIPHVNLDNLPIIDPSEKESLGWMVSLTSLQFSTQEKKLRAAVDRAGLAKDVRVNFKETLFSMFMLSSGAQGGQTGMFLFNHPGRGGVQMLIFVSALRLEADMASVVLDAAIIPLTLKMLESEKLRDFLSDIRVLGGCILAVNDEELNLLKKTIPSLIERCRTWSHLPTCEYSGRGSAAPLSFEHGRQWLCSCGSGKIPDDFVAVPSWKDVAEHAVRIAISPMFSVPFVESVFTMEALDGTTVDENSIFNVKTCGNCKRTESLDGPKLRKCKGCLQTQYCSTECQRADWKKHRMECRYA